MMADRERESAQLWEEIQTLRQRISQLEAAGTKNPLETDLYRLLVEGVREYAIFMLDPDGWVVSWSSGAQRILGYEAPEIIGQHFGRFYTSEDQEAGRPQRELEVAIAGGKSEYEGWRVRRDGSLFWSSVLSSPLYDDGGRLLGFARVMRDLTDRQHAAETLQAKEDELREVSRQLWQTARLATMGELAASIAHELNNPLATMGLHLEGLREKIATDHPAHRHLAVIEEEGDRMANMVASLLQFSRPGPPRISSVDLHEELEKTLELIHFFLKKRGINLKRQYASDLPLIQADRQKLRQLFLNLCTNAGDAMVQGGTLIIRTSRDGCLEGKPGIVVEVVDTGAGIAPEHLPRVMEPFFTTKPEGKGTGLGLSICRRIVAEHHGTIDLTSEVGRGTTVRVVLPIANGANGQELDGPEVAE